MYWCPFASRTVSVFGCAAALLLSGLCQAETDKESNARARDIFQELIEINTTESSGNVTAAAEAMARRLREAGFPAEDLQIAGAEDRKKNLVARLHGTGRHKPILLIGHLDVVEARREDWTTDPFKFVEKDGTFYGRGTQDMKNGDAIMVATLIRLKKEGFRPARDIILALTADEETGNANGVDWLLKNRRDLIDAEFVLNHDTNSVVSDHGRPLFFEMDGTEKVYSDYLLTVTNPGGHSSLPVPDNAIYHISAALERLAKYSFPFELNSVTRSYYERMATIETGPRAADMRAILQSPPDAQAVERLSREAFDNSILRTTCVATRIEGGHANNALPQRAQANVNCRILPGHSPEEVRRSLIEVFADPQIRVQALDERGDIRDVASDRKGYPPPPLSPVIMKPLDQLVGRMWPGLKVIPSMAAGASDGIYTAQAGLPTYLISGVEIAKDNNRAHGKDEDVGAESFYRGNEFYYRYLKEVTSH